MYLEKHKGKVAAIIAVDLHLHAIGYRRTAVFNKIIGPYSGISRRFFFKIIDPKVSVTGNFNALLFIKSKENLSEKERKIATDLSMFLLNMSANYLTPKDLA